MTSRDLPKDAQVVRYVKPTHVREDGSIDGENFRLSTNGSPLSVNWLEYFRGRNKEQQLREVRKLIRLSLRPNGCFAELNVGTTIRDLELLLPAIRFVHSPSEATPHYDADPSHSEIFGLPPLASPESALIGEMISECVGATHPAVA